MAEREFHCLADAARAIGVLPRVLRRWLHEDRLPIGGPAGSVVARRDLEACLKRRGRPLPDAIEPWPKILVMERLPEQVERVFLALKTDLPEAAVRCVLSPSEALAEVSGFDPQLVIVDAPVPPELRGLPLLAVAAEDDTDGARAALAAGAAEVVHRPLTPGMLAESVRRMLRVPAPAPTA